jgi:hypothetical protein
VTQRVHSLHHAAELVLCWDQFISNGTQQVLVCGMVPRHPLISHFRVSYREERCGCQQ